MHRLREFAGRVRPGSILQVVVGLGFVVGAEAAHAEPGQGTNRQRIAALIRQLGDDDFEKREAASEELDAIGEPALDALRKATSDDDAEIRRRAEKIVGAITGRIRAAVTKKELEKLQGTWSRVSYEKDGGQIGGEDKSHTWTVKGDKWWTHAGGQLFNAGTVTSIEVKGKVNAIDLLITEGNGTGVTAITIYAVDGDSLKHLTSGEPRATDFTTKPGDGRHYGIFRRVADSVKK
jgi:uncharacterized protein (TIGR03067 family)